MTQKKVTKGRRKWPDIFLLIASVSIIQIQMTVASTHQKNTNVTHESLNALSPNGTDLRKTDQVVDVVPLEALNDDNNDDGERRMPFQSPTMPSTSLPSSIERTPVAVTNSISNIHIEKSLSTGQDSMKISNKLYKIEATSTEKVSLPDENLETLKQNTFVQLTKAAPYKMTDDKNQDISHTKLNDQSYDDKKLLNIKPAMISHINETDVNYLGASTESIKSPHNINDIPRNDEKRGNLDLVDNVLREVEKNLTNTESTTAKSTTNPIFFDVKMKNKINNDSLSTNHTDITNNIQDLKLNTSPSTVTENSTLMPQIIDTYSPSTLSSFTSSRNLLNTSSSTSFSSIPSTLEIDVPVSTTTANKLETTTFTTFSPTSASVFPTSSMMKADSSSEQTIDITPTTIPSVEYEFIGLNSTSLSENDQTSNDESTSNITTVPNTSSSVSSTISELPLENNTETTDNNVTVTNPNTYDTSTIINSSNIDELLSTVDNKYFDTTHPIIINSESYDTTIDDQTTTLSPDTTIFTYNPSSTSSITTIENGSSNIVDTSSESTVSDIPTIFTTSTIPTTTMTTVPSSSMSEFSVEPEITTMTNEFTTASSIGDTTTISTILTTVEIVHSVPQDITGLVRIVVEKTLSDVCSHLHALRQALADALSAGMNKNVSAHQVIFKENPCRDNIKINGSAMESPVSITLLLYVVDQDGKFDLTSTKNLPNLYNKSEMKLTNVSIFSFQLVDEPDSGNAIAVIVVCCVAFICLILLASLLFIMRKRQTRFNYGERCRPVSLDAYSLDNVSTYNSVRRKGEVRMSKRSYGNPTFEDSSIIPSHPLNFAGLSAFCNQQSAIFEEFTSIPQVSGRIDELPNGADIKNRYANVIPLPETRVPLKKINDDPLSEYINASYIRGPKNTIKYYIGCQAPLDTTVIDFWRMIWEQQSKVIIMLTDLIENGVEKCAEYLPPSEVTDCHRLYGDFQVTLKKRETKEKYAISTLHLKNLENNTYREISHIWYLWPTSGIQTDATGLIAVLLEARAVQRGSGGPIVVHCSPGTGRTGTIIALDLGIRQYEITRTVDVPRVVYTIRRDRAGAVQTKEQYFFIYKALNLYAAKLAGGGLEST